VPFWCLFRVPKTPKKAKPFNPTPRAKVKKLEPKKDFTSSRNSKKVTQNRWKNWEDGRINEKKLYHHRNSSRRRLRRTHIQLLRGRYPRT